MPRPRCKMPYSLSKIAANEFVFPRKKSMMLIWRQEAKKKNRNGKNIYILTTDFIGGQRYKCRTSIPGVMEMHFSGDNLPSGLYVVLKA